MLCTTSCAELTNTLMILRYQRIELERQRCCMAPASGRGAQWSACIKTMSVCFIRRINAFFDAWSVSRPIFCVERAEIFPPCRLSCVSDRPAVEGVYASRMLRQAGHTQVVSMQTKTASHDYCPVARASRLPPCFAFQISTCSRGKQHAYPLLLCILQRL